MKREGKMWILDDFSVEVDDDEVDLFGKSERSQDEAQSATSFDTEAREDGERKIKRTNRDDNPICERTRSSTSLTEHLKLSTTVTPESRSDDQLEVTSGERDGSKMLNRSAASVSRSSFGRRALLSPSARTRTNP